MVEQVTSLLKECVRRRQVPLCNSTGIRYKQFDEFDGDQQVELKHRCETQSWVGICDVTFEKFGRGLISIQRIKKDDVVVDYHGKVIECVPYEQYSLHPGVLPEYCMEIPGPPKRIIDASSEVCGDHPGNRCLGRFANHCNANQRNNAQNMKSADVLLDKLEPPIRVVVLKARRNIEPFEQLRFDYGDDKARKLFSEKPADKSTERQHSFE